MVTVRAQVVSNSSSVPLYFCGIWDARRFFSMFLLYPQMLDFSACLPKEDMSSYALVFSTVLHLLLGVYQAVGRCWWALLLSRSVFVLGRPCVPGFLTEIAFLPMTAQCCLWLWWFSVWKRVFILFLSGQGLPIVLGQDLGPGSKVNSLILPKQHGVFTCALEPWMCCLFTQLLFTEDQSLGRILCLSHRQLPPFLHATMEGLSPVSCPFV